MTDTPNSDLREAVYKYLRGCEHLLAAANGTLPFTEEELSIIKYYQGEIGKIPSVETS